MELLIYYSHHHKCYRCKFGYLLFDQEVGYRNGFDEELMLYTVSGVLTLSFRERIIKFLKKILYRLETPKRKKAIYKKMRYPKRG